MYGITLSEVDIEKEKRRERVEHIFQALPPLQILRSLHHADDLPRISLYGAAKRFVQGTYEDCIFHSAFSVEMALLLRLDSQLTSVEKESIRKEAIQNKTGLMFGKIVTMAKKKDILIGAGVKKARKLNLMRNMYVHPANWVAFLKQQYRVALDFENEMPEMYAMAEQLLASMKFPIGKDAASKALEPAEKKVRDYVKPLERIPDLDWCASQDTLRFQKKRAKDYYKKSIEDVLSPKGLEDLIEHAGDIVRYAQSRYSYLERDAYEALAYAYDILRALTVF